jgi:hypothetical protein
MELPTVDPCGLLKDWLVIYKDRPFKLSTIYRNEHDVPVKVGVEGWGYEPSVRFLIENGVVLEPVLNPHASWRDVVGYRPVQLKWRVNPDVMARILAPEIKGQIIGVIESEIREINHFSALVGRFTGDYKYRSDGVVMASLDPKFWFRTHGSAEGLVKRIESPASDYNQLLIGDFDSLLPNTSATLDFLHSVKDHATYFNEFVEGIESLAGIQVAST